MPPGRKRSKYRVLVTSLLLMSFLVYVESMRKVPTTEGAPARKARPQKITGAMRSAKVEAIKAKISRQRGEAVSAARIVTLSQKITPALTTRVFTTGRTAAQADRRNNAKFLSMGVDQRRRDARGSRKLRNANSKTSPALRRIKQTALEVEAATVELVQTLGVTSAAELSRIPKPRNVQITRPKVQANVVRQEFINAKDRDRKAGRGPKSLGRVQAEKSKTRPNRPRPVRPGVGSGRVKGGARGKRQVFNPFTFPCPYPDESTIGCDPFYIYRTSSGICNNLFFPLDATQQTPFKRLIYPTYDNVVNLPRTLAFPSTPGSPSLPTPRDISNIVHKDSATTVHQDDLTLWVMQWGQYTDHDLTLTPVETGENGAEVGCCIDDILKVDPSSSITQAQLDNRPECFKIPLDNDPHPAFNARTCMNFARSVPTINRACNFGPREQINEITGYIDASNVYGSTFTKQQELRADKGQMKVTAGLDLLPPSDAAAEGCTLPTTNPTPGIDVKCFDAGDIRSAEQSGLTTIHTAFVREHNRMAKYLYDNTLWDSDTTYQETKRIIGAIHQHITYKEWLPIILGNQLSTHSLQINPGYSNTYNPIVDASISNGFATAAFRFGHSLIPKQLPRAELDHSAGISLNLRDVFFQPVHMYNNDSDPTSPGGPSAFTRGLNNGQLPKFDRHLTEEVLNHLFQAIGDPTDALDLAALNIQRGRDHGIPSYTAWRDYCGLGRPLFFEDLLGGPVQQTHSVAAVDKLAFAYSDVEDIDLFTGGLTEDSVPGGVVGKTFACIIGQQFSDLRRGDRFWFENQFDVTKDIYYTFTSQQLASIKTTSLAGVLCQTMDINEIQPNVFKSHLVTGNARVPCSQIPQVNMALWLNN